MARLVWSSGGGEGEGSGVRPCCCILSFPPDVPSVALTLSLPYYYFFSFLCACCRRGIVCHRWWETRVGAAVVVAVATGGGRTVWVLCGSRWERACKKKRHDQQTPPGRRGQRPPSAERGTGRRQGDNHRAWQLGATGPTDPRWRPDHRQAHPRARQTRAAEAAEAPRKASDKKKVTRDRQAEFLVGNTWKLEPRPSSTAHSATTGSAATG